MNQIMETVCTQAGVEFVALNSRRTDTVLADWDANAYRAIGELIAERLAPKLSDPGEPRPH